MMKPRLQFGRQCWDLSFQIKEPGCVSFTQIKGKEQTNFISLLPVETALGKTTLLM